MLRYIAQRLAQAAVIVAIVAVIAVIVIPNHTQRPRDKPACINNLKRIEEAKEQWALENKAGQNATPTQANIQPYLGRGSAGTAPVCPADPGNSFATSYSINDLGSNPSCLVQPGAPSDTSGHHLD